MRRTQSSLDRELLKELVVEGSANLTETGRNEVENDLIRRVMFFDHMSRPDAQTYVEKLLAEGRVDKKVRDTLRRAHTRRMRSSNPKDPALPRPGLQQELQRKHAKNDEQSDLFAGR